MWESLRETFDSPIFELETTGWLMAAGTLVVTALALALLRRLMAGRLQRLSEIRRLHSLEVAVGMLQRTSWVFYLAAGLHVATVVVELPERLASAARVAVVIGVFYQMGLWASEAVAQAVQRYRGADEDPAQATALAAMRFVGRLLVWAAVLLVVLDNLGFDITALVASLGIGGVAVALAVQNILGDLFASLSIIIDKPFVVGDFIIVGDFMGVVEKIGMKTTRVKSLSGEQIIFSNNDLLKSRVRNYQRMEERRVVFEFGVVYQTSTEQIEHIPAMAREIIEETDQTRFDRAHFKAFGDSAFKFEVVYYVLSSDYNVYMDIHQAIILSLLRRFRQEGIDFAYPTRTVHLEGRLTDGEASAPAAMSA